MKKENRIYLILGLFLLSLLLIPLASTQTVLLAQESDKLADDPGGVKEDCVTLIVHKKIPDLPPMPPQVYSVDPSPDEPPEPLEFTFILVPEKEDGSLDLDDLDNIPTLVMTADKPASICVPRGVYYIFEVFSGKEDVHHHYTKVSFFLEDETSCEELLSANSNLLYKDYDECVRDHRRWIIKNQKESIIKQKGYRLDLSGSEPTVKLKAYNHIGLGGKELIGIIVKKQWAAADGLDLPEIKEAKLELRKNYYELIDGTPTSKRDVKVEYFDVNFNSSPIDKNKIDPDPLVFSASKKEHEYSLRSYSYAAGQFRYFTHYLCFHRYDTTGREIEYFFKELNTPPGFIFKEHKNKLDLDSLKWEFIYENYYAGLGTITVKKELKDSSADQDRIFNFRLSAKKEDLITGPKDQDYLLEFSLKAGEEKVIPDLELGTYTLEELNPGEYDVTYHPAQTVTINEESMGEREVTISVINRLPEPPLTTTVPTVPLKTTPTLRPSEPEETVVQPKPSLPVTGEMPSMDFSFIAALALTAALLLLLKKKS